MRNTIVAIRYLLPAVIVLVGLVLVAINPTANWEGGAAVIGAGLSVALLNLLHRIGVDGDRDRDREDEQRKFYDAHGYWPDERPRRPSRE
ncbi:MAG TPA: hypothetical protein VGM91_06010 [Conexibacter sp.]|jgi:hypothetical protein